MILVASRALVIAMNSMAKADFAWIWSRPSMRMAITFSRQAAVALAVAESVVRKTVSSWESMSFQKPSV
jgi:hypothetical protein